MSVFGKIGGGFKWLGSKLLGILRRGETLFAIKFASNFFGLPIPALDKIVYLVWQLDASKQPGPMKMAIALEDVIPILAEYDIQIDEESDLRLLIELAISTMKGKTRVVEVE